ncbi:MAG: DUF2125 domain-containing protein [Devosia sp.]
MRRIVWLTIAVVIVVAGWSTGWLFAAGELKKQVDQLALNDGETAPRFTCGTLNISGYPFRFDLDCVDGTLVDQDLTLTFPGLRASVLAYNPTHVIFSGRGPFTWADAFSGSQRRLDFTALNGSLRLTAGDFIRGFSGETWRLARLSVEGDELTVTDVVAGDVFEASARRFEAHLVDVPEQLDLAAGTATLAEYVKVEGLTLPGVTIYDADFTLDAQLTAIPADLRDLATADPVRDWQARGGTLKLAQLAGTQASPEESFEITGDLRLNGGGYVEGQLDYKTKGALDRLSAVVTPINLAMLKGAPQPDGTFANTLNIADGQVKLLTFVFMILPPLF